VRDAIALLPDRRSNAADPRHPHSSILSLTARLLCAALLCARHGFRAAPHIDARTIAPRHLGIDEAGINGESGSIEPMRTSPAVGSERFSISRYARSWLPGSRATRSGMRFRSTMPLHLSDAGANPPAYLKLEAPLAVVGAERLLEHPGQA
jgi:hypothetical protein